MSKSAENMTENLAPCPFCGSRDLSIERFPTLRETSKFHVHCQKCGMAGPSLVSVYCYAGAVLPDLTNAWNSRATTAPKHRPAEVVTGEDADRISKALFNADVCIDHLLPLYATPCNPGRLDGGWEELLNDLLGCDRGELISIFGKVGEHMAAALDDMDKDLPGDAEAEALREVFYQIGGWGIIRHNAQRTGPLFFVLRPLGHPAHVCGLGQDLQAGHCQSHPGAAALPASGGGEGAGGRRAWPGVARWSAVWPWWSCFFPMFWTA